MFTLSSNIEFGDLPFFLGAWVYVLLAIRLLLVSVPAKTRKANLYLVVLFVIFAILLFDEFLSMTVSNWELPNFINIWLNASHLLLGPLTYLYISSMLFANRRVISNLKHLSPSLIFLILAMLSEQIPTSENNQAIFLGVFVAFYLATLLPYILMSLTTLDSYIGESKNLFSNLLNHNLNWARFWLMFMMTLAIFIVINPIMKLVGVIDEPLFDIHYLVALAGLVLLVWPNSAEQIALAQSSDEPKQARLDPKPNEDDDTLTTVFDDIFSTIKSKQLFLINGLTLTDVANNTGYNIELISKAINQIGGQCFYDFINDFRIEESKCLLVTHHSRSILDIAMQSGFNSKSAFYKAFDKREKQTPSSYRQKQ